MFSNVNTLHHRRAEKKFLIFFSPSRTTRTVVVVVYEPSVSLEKIKGDNLWLIKTSYENILTSKILSLPLVSLSLVLKLKFIERFFFFCESNAAFFAKMKHRNQTENSSLRDQQGTGKKERRRNGRPKFCVSLESLCVACVLITFAVQQLSLRPTHNLERSSPSQDLILNFKRFPHAPLVHCWWQLISYLN